MNQPAGTTIPSKSEKFVVDGVNVCFWYKHPYTGRDLVSVRPLLVLLCEIREHGDDFYCVFDHTIKDRLTSKREARLIEWLVHKYPAHFYRTAIDSRADPVILHYADKHQCRIITNDRYRDFFEQFEWLSKRNTPRLVQGNYNQSGLLTLEKLSYGYMELDPNTYTQVLVDRLVRCLERNFDRHSVRDERVVQDEGAGIVLEKQISAPSPATAAPASSATRQTSRGKAVATKKSRLKKPAEVAEAKASKTTAKSKTTKSPATKARTKTASQQPTVKPKKPTRKRATATRRRRSPPRKKAFLNGSLDEKKVPTIGCTVFLTRGGFGIR